MPSEPTSLTALPLKLVSLGATVTSVAGYEIRITSTADEARQALSRRLDLLALANPTAVRILARAREELGLDLDRCLASVVVAAVGRATARTAEGAGTPPDHISAGRLTHLVSDIVRLYAANPHPQARRPGT